jgi:hypothetical protein
LNVSTKRRAPLARGAPRAKTGGGTPTSRLACPRSLASLNVASSGAPGLGWSKQYESNLSKGYGTIVAIVAKAMPSASEGDRAKAIDAAAHGAGVLATKAMGQVNMDVYLGSTTEQQATAALAALTSGEVTADDIADRGSEALTNPRPKGERRNRRARRCRSARAGERRDLHAFGVGMMRGTRRSRASWYCLT